MNVSIDWIVPDWPVPKAVRALITTRTGGVSEGPYASLNLGDHVGDDAHAVASNRAILQHYLPSPPSWLKQVHGTSVMSLHDYHLPVESDASVAFGADGVCAIMTADCLPVLLCDDTGAVVAAAHAGWRGLCAGVIENAVSAMKTPAEKIMAYLGPAIGPQHFEVGDEVRRAFMQDSAEAARAFIAKSEGKWLADIYLLARQRLNAIGVTRIYGGEFCTVAEQRFFSYRRDKITGRMASFIWLEK
jgi:polyphenol oxidase